MPKAFSITDIGRKRNINQDYVFASEETVGSLPNLFIVADGMGGHNAGEYASKYTVETIVEEISKDKETDPETIIKRAIEAANDKIRQMAMENLSLYGMGTTVVVATYEGRKMTVANVGDSRLYVKGSELEQITKDHSLVEELVRMGTIQKSEARNHPDKNIITRAVGADKTVQIDFFTVELKDNDLILMCSDGLTNMLEDEEISSILSRSAEPAQKAAELIRNANDNGGKDNIAVILIEPI